MSKLNVPGACPALQSIVRQYTQLAYDVSMLQDASLESSDLVLGHLSQSAATT